MRFIGMVVHRDHCEVAIAEAGRVCSARAGFRLSPRCSRLSPRAAAAAHAADGSVDQQDRLRGGCSLNSNDRCLIRVDRYLRVRQGQEEAAELSVSRHTTSSKAFRLIDETLLLEIMISPCRIQFRPRN